MIWVKRCGILSRKLIRQIGWTGRKLRKDSDRVKATRSAIAYVPVANLYWRFKVRDESAEEFNKDEQITKNL